MGPKKSNDLWRNIRLYLSALPHRVAYYVSGNPQGIPLLSIHGGPGSGSSPRQISAVDPKIFRVVQIDQRGCGQSTPIGLLDWNTPQDLIRDMEAVRLELKIQQWRVLAGSWGASLAILYAHEHPQSVSRLILRNTFLCSNDEIDQFFQGVNQRALWADLWSEQPQARQRAVKQWQALENPNQGSSPIHGMDVNVAVQKYRLQAHYIQHHFFLPEGYLEECFQNLVLDRIDLLHGTVDRICPPANSIRLARLNPRAHLHLISGCSHDPFHPDMVRRTVELLSHP